MSKISKTVLPCSGDLVAGQTNRMPPVVSLHRSFLRLTGGSKIRREKDLENFQKFWVFSFLATQFGGLFTSGSFNRELTQKFLQLPSRLPCGWNFQSRKILRQNFQKFCLKCLTTYPGDLYATWYSREKSVFCAFWIDFKNF